MNQKKLTEKEAKMPKKEIDKYTFKICEAVHLGLDYYYMGPRDRRTLTKDDIEVAQRILPTLPDGWYREKYDWMQQKHSWDACKA